MRPIVLEPLPALENYCQRLLHRFQPKPCRCKRQDSSAFTLTYILRLRSCRRTGDFIISPLPPFLTEKLRAAGPLRSAGITPLHRYYGPSRHRLAFSSLPGTPGYRTYLAPPISRWGEDGFSSCSACPCHRAAPTTPPEWCAASVSLRHIILPSPRSRGLGLRKLFSDEATCGFTHVAAR